MTPRVGEHRRFRELISARLDRPLPHRTERELVQHLSRCARCRAVDGAYREQKRLLRSLPQRSAPRDMWPRTATALDREMAGRRWRGGRPLSVPRGVVVTSAAVFGLALVLGSAQLGPAPEPERSQATARALPTPFRVPAQKLAYLGETENGLVLYTQDVDQVCPPSSLACLDEDTLAPLAIELPRKVRPRNLSISPNGEKMAMIGQDHLSEAVYAIVLQTPAPEQPATDRPLAATAVPAQTDEPSQSGEPEEAATPAQTHGLAQTDEPAQTDGPAPTAEVAQTDGPADPTPDVWPSATEFEGVGSPIPAPSATSPPILTTVAILDDVRTAGGPAAWSADGSVFAFSAMPADGSHGPDIYVWSAEDDLALPLTTDHGSYFASWAGQRIVANRIRPAPEEDVEQVVDTLVIDLDTGEERAVRARDLWLPQVSPLGGQAVTWHGRLTSGESGVQPQQGALYLADWQLLDPFNVDEPSSAPAVPEPGVSAAPEPGVNSTREPGLSADPARKAPRDRQVMAAPTPMLTLPPDEVSPLPEIKVAGDETVAESPEPAQTIDEQPTIPLIALEPERDPEQAPVLDWNVRWSSDGAVIGYWISDAPGASWGQLTVLSLDPETGLTSYEEPLLRSTLARRSFTLGISRVAWVGPTEDDPNGEVRIRTWGPAGFGGLRVPSHDLREMVPTF